MNCYYRYYLHIFKIISQKCVYRPMHCRQWGCLGCQSTPGMLGFRKEDRTRDRHSFNTSTPGFEKLSTTLYIVCKLDVQNQVKFIYSEKATKILRNLHLTFDHRTHSQKLGEDFAIFCGLLRIYELYTGGVPSKLFSKILYLL